jgi:hypothetical protein
MTNIEDIKKSLDEAQNEYHEILHNIFSNNLDTLDKDRGSIYYWERAKKLQQRVIHMSFIEREIALDNARKALEKAFTPRIKEMLSKKLQNEIEEDG